MHTMSKQEFNTKVLFQVLNDSAPSPITRDNSPPSIEAKLILDCKCILGECVLYDDAKDSILWTDIYGKQLHKLDLNSGTHWVHSVPKMLGAFALLPKDKDGFLCAWEDGFQYYDIEGCKALSKMSLGEEVNPKKLPTRLNDGRVDPTGKRFICGGYYGDVEGNIMKVYKCEHIEEEEPKLVHEAVVDSIRVTNSICFSPDGKSMYIADSPTGQICKHDYDNQTGKLANKIIVSTNQIGVPDGSCTDMQGNIWNAVWRAGAGPSMVNCIHPVSGEVLFTVNMPDSTSQVTCCCFGGRDMDVLFITTAATGRDPEKEPHAGGLYAIKLNVKGCQEKRFIGK